MPSCKPTTILNPLPTRANSIAPGSYLKPRPYVGNGFTLHWYQVEALEEIRQKFMFEGSKDELVVLPTGTGKSSVASYWVNECQDRRESVLILVNRDKLLQQMEAELNENGIFPVIEQANRHGLWEFGAGRRVVLASVQTLHKDRLPTWPRDAFDQIISDEAHWAASPQWVKVRNYFSKARHLGLSATPFPLEKLKRIFRHPFIRKVTMRDAIEGGFLSRLHLLSVDSGIDLRGIKILDNKDFDQDELDRIIYDHTNQIATDIKAHMIKPDGSYRPTVVFTPHVQSAEAIAAAMRDMGVPFSSISYRSADPDAIHRRFKAGEVWGLSNVAILAEGWNAPWVEMVVLACPTLKPGPVTQKIGRGTRKSLATGKENCLILEFDCITSKKNLRSSFEAILDGAEEEKKPTKAEAKQRARVAEKLDAIVKTREEIDLLEAHELAKEQVSQEDREAREKKLSRARYRESKTRSVVRAYDPHAGLPSRPSPQRDRVESLRPATPEMKAQVEALSKGIIKTESLSAGAAQDFVEMLEFRRRAGLSTEPQRRFMVRLGCDPRVAASMTKAQASGWIAQHKPSNWK